MRAGIPDLAYRLEGAVVAHLLRSSRAWSVDDARAARTAKSVEAWLRDPGRYDYPGLDTPGSGVRARDALEAVKRYVGPLASAKIREEAFQRWRLKVEPIIGVSLPRAAEAVRAYSGLLAKLLSDLREAERQGDPCRIREIAKTIIFIYRQLQASEALLQVLAMRARRAISEGRGTAKWRRELIEALEKAKAKAPWLRAVI